MPWGESVQDWKDHCKRWENMSMGWERMVNELNAQRDRSNALLVAASILHPECPHLTEYARLFRELMEAARAIYFTPKVGIHASEENVERLMDATSAISRKMGEDKLL